VARWKSETADKEIAERLRKARLDAGQTLEETSRILGISKDTLWNYEHGNTDLRVSHLRTLCATWQIDPAVILFGASKTLLEDLRT
jgi:transcriptional regulator with XRE-family HTH domain